MTKKIILSILTAFIITITIFFLFQLIFENEIHGIQKEFYMQNFDQQSKKILLIGSSHVGQINATYVQNYISKEFQKHEVYNLADTADKPRSRLNSLDEIISLKPDIVVYGLGYRDFSEPKIMLKETILPDPQSILENIISIILYDVNTEFFENPKLSTLKIIQGIIGIKTLVSDSVFEKNTPFYPYHKTKTDIIVKQSEIEKNDFYKEEFVIKSTIQNKQVQALKKIILELEKNNIKMIIFITPHNKFYQNSLSVDNEEKFNLIINELIQNQNIKIFNLIDYYDDLEIWRSTNHISHNSKSLIYSEDIAQIIILELSH
jgi:hypothetical protein